jgi:hypothetical protein
MFKKSLAIGLFTLALGMSTFSQQTIGSQQKAEQLESLLSAGGIIEVRIFANPLVKAYSKEWISNYSISNGFVKFKKNENVHTWDIGSAVLIEKNGDVIYVHLANKAE